jgi:RNA recognition motif-containing protein
MARKPALCHLDARGYLAFFISLTAWTTMAGRSAGSDSLKGGGGLKTLYVGNLPWSTTEERLGQVFSVHGEVHNCRIITDRETGRSRGFGFIEVDDSAAESMISSLNNTDLDGRLIVVNEARPRQNRM